MLVGNPEVADVDRPQTDRPIVVVGKAMGITNLIAYDAAGAEVFNSSVIVGARGGWQSCNSRAKATS